MIKEIFGKVKINQNIIFCIESLGLFAINLVKMKKFEEQANSTKKKV